MTETVCIIGHRSVELSNSLENDITKVLRGLVENRKVRRFCSVAKVNLTRYVIE